MGTKSKRKVHLTRPIPAHWIGIKKNWQRTCQSLSEALVSIRPEDLATHGLVIGSTGSGKTNLIHHLVAQDILKGHSLVVLDARGDLARAVLELAARAGIDPARIQFLNLREKERPTGFNPFAGQGEPYYRALCLLSAIEAESESWGVQIAETLRNAALLLSEAKSALTNLEPLFYDPHVRRSLIQQARSEGVLAFWKRYNLLTPDRQAALAGPVLNKVSILLSTETLRKVFGHPEPIDLEKQLNTPGSITLVSLAVDELHAAGWMTGSLFLSSVCREIFSRTDIPESQRVPVRLVVDEFEHFGMGEFENILAEGRRYKCSLLLAHQALAQLAPKMRSMILGNVGVKAVFRAARQDADVLCRDLTGNAKSFDLATLPVGEALLWRRGEEPVHVEVNAPIIRDVGSLSPKAKSLLELIRSRTPIAEASPVALPIDGDDEPEVSSLEEWL